MKSKRDALIRDIAVLFTKYSLADWQEVISLLRAGGPDLTTIASNLDTFIEAQSRAKISRSRSSKSKKAQLEKEAVVSAKGSTRSEVTERKSSDLLRRRLVAKNMSALRNIYALSGGKGELPSNREASMDALIKHLDELPRTQLNNALKMLEDKEINHGSDYDKWVKIISGQEKS